MREGGGAERRLAVTWKGELDKFNTSLRGADLLVPMLLEVEL